MERDQVLSLLVVREVFLYFGIQFKINISCSNISECSPRQLKQTFRQSTHFKTNWILQCNGRLPKFYKKKTETPIVLNFTSYDKFDNGFSLFPFIYSIYLKFTFIFISYRSDMDNFLWECFHMGISIICFLHRYY